MAEKHQYSEEIIEKIENVDLKELMLFNDDVNTFQHVIDMLCKYCDHDAIQAEQCAWIVHSRGKCQVKSGKLSDLRKRLRALTQNGLSAQIE